MALAHPAGDELRDRIEAVGHAHRHEVQRAADTFLLAPVLGVGVLGVGERMEREHHPGVLDGRPQRLVLRPVVGLRTIRDRHLDRTVAELRGPLDLRHRLPDVVHRGHRHRREPIAVGAEVLARPVVPRLRDRELVVRRRRHEQAQRLVRIDDLGAHPVAREVGEAPVDIAPAARIVTELAVAVVVGDARVGHVEPARAPPVDDEIARAVALDDARRAVAERLRDALVELGRLLHVRVGRDDLVHRSLPSSWARRGLSWRSVGYESRTGEAALRTDLACTAPLSGRACGAPSTRRSLVPSRGRPLSGASLDRPRVLHAAPVVKIDAARDVRAARRRRREPRYPRVPARSRRREPRCGVTATMWW